MKKMPIYRDKFAEQAFRLCLLGATNEQLGVAFGVRERTISRWIADRDDFREAVLAGRDGADSAVAVSMYNRAKGYTIKTERAFHHRGKVTKVKVREHIPADVGAGKFWLTNRRRQDWGERVGVEHTGRDGGPIEFDAKDRLTRLIDRTAALQIEGPSDSGSDPEAG